MSQQISNELSPQMLAVNLEELLSKSIETISAPAFLNSFANKLVKYLYRNKHTITNRIEESDTHLCFIESYKATSKIPLFQRLDGIYALEAAEQNLYRKTQSRIHHLHESPRPSKRSDHQPPAQGLYRQL